MKINVYGASSVGRVRKLNEDSFSFDSSRGDKGSIFLICDGMGGHKAGEIACGGGSGGSFYTLESRLTCTH